MRSYKWIAPVGIASFCLLVVMTWWDEDFEDSSAESYIADLSTSTDAADAPLSKRSAESAQSQLNSLTADVMQSGTAEPEPGTRSSLADLPSCAAMKTSPTTERANRLPDMNYEDPRVPIDVKTIDPDRDGCHSIAETIKRAAFLFDITPKQVVWYGGPAAARNPPIDRSRMPLNPLMLADRICTGSRPFDDTTKPKFELEAVSNDANATIYIGENWVSDGRIVSSLSESEYTNVTRLLLGREAQGVGQNANMDRERFDDDMAKLYFNRKAAATILQRERDDDLRRAQEHSPAECAK